MHVNFIIPEIDSMSQTVLKVNLMSKYEVDGCTVRLSAQVVITALSAYLITFLIQFLCKKLQRLTITLRDKMSKHPTVGSTCKNLGEKFPDYSSYILELFLFLFV